MPDTPAARTAALEARSPMTRARRSPSTTRSGATTIDGDTERTRDADASLGCACATARQLARVLTQLYDGHLRRAGVEAPQFALLMALQKGGPCRQSELGQRHALDKTTVSRNLKVLARKGWIAFEGTTDRRERHVALTAAGRARLRRASTQWSRAQRALRSAMPEEQWRALFDNFRAVLAAAQPLPQVSCGRPRAIHP